jgi:hypothetical protein
MADVEAKMAEKDANFQEIIGSLQNELKEKADEIEKMRESKRVFADRGEKSAVSESEMVDAHLLGVVTQKGLETRLGRAMLEKQNTNSGVTVPAGASIDAYETTVSTAIERDIELELVLDPMFRKVAMNSSAMLIPTMPDSGYAEWSENDTTGGVPSGAFKGNLEDRDATNGSPYTGIGLSQVTLTTDRLISKSFIANETEEDAILPILPLIREAMVRSHARAIEHSILCAGSTAAVNPGGQNGLIKLATDASKVLDNAASPGTGVATTEALLNMRQAMGKYGRRPADVMYIVSLDAYYDLLDDGDFQTINEVGDQRAVRITGEIANVYGSPVVVCDEFKAKASQEHWAVAVNTRNFVIPTLRGVTVESDYDVENQRRVLVATQRRGFKNIFADGAGGQVVAHTW